MNDRTFTLKASHTGVTVEHRRVYVTFRSDIETFYNFAVGKIRLNLIRLHLHKD